MCRRGVRYGSIRFGKSTVSNTMKLTEYALSLVMALLLLGTVAAWTHADYAGDQARFSCRPGKPSPAVTMKGMVVYPRCIGKRG